MALVQKVVGIFTSNFARAYRHVHEHYDKFRWHLEMVTRKSFGNLAHFKWNDPYTTGIGLVLVSLIPATIPPAIRVRNCACHCCEMNQVPCVLCTHYTDKSSNIDDA